MGSLRITKDTKAEGKMNTIPKGSKIPDNSERTDYSYEVKKWYSKEDPLTINVSDKNLADAFTE